MRPQVTLLELLSAGSKLLGQSFREWSQPAAGADHLVVIATTETGTKVAIKAGLEANVDAHVLRGLQSVAAPIPSLLAEGRIDNAGAPCFLTIMTFVEGALLADLTDGSAHLYLAPLLEAMRGVHEIATVDGAGPVLSVVNGSRLSWKTHLLGILTGEHPEFNWPAIATSPGVDGNVLRRALDLAITRVGSLPAMARYSLLHGDLNPHNVFVRDDQISGIIDWSYARFGDPLFDFARLRINPFVRSNPNAVDLYFSLLNLDRDERMREETYYLFNLVEYVNWYVLDDRPEGVAALMTLLSGILEIE